jgi:3,4-dihydroxy 2-butanone 4-phosphate synthase/GTP cyclohydrolase II
MIPPMPHSTIEEGLDRIRKGQQAIVFASETGESCLVLAAEKITADAVNFMATHARGLICLGMMPEQMRALGIPLMVPESGIGRRPFGASIEARKGVTTGISAADRARTIRVCVAANAGPEDIVMPGHIFPIEARPGGVLARPGLTEAAVDLARLAGLRPMAATCTILDDDGELAQWKDLEALAARFSLPLLPVADLVAHRLRHESLVRRVTEATIHSEVGGRFRAVVYRSDVDPHEHIALVKGKISPRDTVPVRIHSQCLTGDVLGSSRCDCGEQLVRSMQIIEREGKGVLVYMHQEGRGIGLANKLRAYALQDQGRDTVEANLELGFKEDGRDYGLSAQILRDLGVRSVRLMTNNPHKIASLVTYGITVVERLPIEIAPHEGNIRYLRTKKEKLGHLISGIPLMT